MFLQKYNLGVYHWLNMALRMSNTAFALPAYNKPTGYTAFAERFLDGREYLVGNIQITHPVAVAAQEMIVRRRVCVVAHRSIWSERALADLTSLMQAGGQPVNGRRTYGGELFVEFVQYLVVAGMAEATQYLQDSLTVARVARCRHSTHFWMTLPPIECQSINPPMFRTLVYPRDFSNSVAVPERLPLLQYR
jgi:hypothetical protein